MLEVDEREEELSTLSAIFPELAIDPADPFCAILRLSVAPTKPLLVRFIPESSIACDTRDYSRAAMRSAAHVEHDIELSHLPPLSLSLKLPHGYPADAPPEAYISTDHDWLPSSKVAELQNEISNLWEEYGRCQILFAYIDYLQQQSEDAFQLPEDGCLVLPITAETPLLRFDSITRQATFDTSTYDCEICLEPKKGLSCYKLRRCGHVFCRQCLQDCYNNAISEGTISNVKCLSPDCGKSKTGSGAKQTTKRLLHPRELLAMGIDDGMVRRYVEMKRKKKIESDRSTVYCPRTWCQSPAKNAQYPPIPADLSSYGVADSSSEDESEEANTKKQTEPLTGRNIAPEDRLAVCEKCQLAFCKVCYMGWHGPFARCYPRDPAELSAEEQASYDYIRLHTSPCPYCNAPTQKTYGCNHMQCSQCDTHFCLLCSFFLESRNPYAHFNKPGTDCYQRLFELEQGDEGQEPADGRGWAGVRRWEQLAIEVAREADAREAAEAAEAGART